MTATDWMLRGACRDVDPEAFYPVGDNTLTDTAVAACDRCPVRDQCLAYALAPDTRQDSGIWAATTPAWRRRHTRRLRPAAAATPTSLPEMAS